MQQNNNYGRDQYILNQPGTVIVNSPAAEVRDPIQRKLLEIVRKEVCDRLAQSLHQVVETSLLNLPKGAQPSQVQSPWQMELHQERQPPHLLPSDITIAQVFDQPDVESKLLILGEPGSGKTTTLLELARELIRRAETSVEQPIPVLLNLSTWKPPKDTKHDPFLSWLLTELKVKYGIRQDLSQKWLATNQLLPLLDGLDEVAPQHQEACAKAINQWLTADVEQRPMGLVVCCRLQEYEEIVQKRLFLNGAIALQPLTIDQIRTYLAQFGLDQVWHSAQTSKTLQDLLSKPLFLSIFGFVASQKQFDVSEWQRCTTETAQREYLLDQYWDAATTRNLVSVKEQEKNIQSKTYGSKAPLQRKALRRALVFAAKAMEQESLTELLIERIQPRWLPRAQQRWSYRLLFGLLLGLLFGLFLGLFFELVLRLIFGLFFGLILGLFFGLFLGLIKRSDNIVPVEAIQISISHFTQRKTLRALRQRLIFGLITGLLFGLIGGLLFGSFFALIDGLMDGLITGLIIGGIGGLFFGLVFGLFFGLIGGLMSSLKADIATRIQPNQGIKNSRRNMLLTLSLAGVLFFPFRGVLEITLAKIIDSELVSAIVVSSLFCLLWFSFQEGGGQALFQHIALRLVMRWNGYAPFRYDRLLDYATERLLLQRIGGRYRFMHKLLQEHFATMELD